MDFHHDPIITCHYLPQDNKFDDGSLYVHQTHTVQIIQLVEGPPPPPRNLASAFASSSESYASSSEDSESWYEEDEEEEEQNMEEEIESYCSSEEEEVAAAAAAFDLRSSSTDTYSLRMKRILAWRENFSAQISATLSEPTLPTSLKRKLSFDDDDDIASQSQSSKRSRSVAPSTVSSLGLHSCPACDASFDTEQSLRQHGTDATANEACSVAVEYAFE